jgi:hypothetical protein
MIPTRSVQVKSKPVASSLVNLTFDDKQPSFEERPKRGRPAKSAKREPEEVKPKTLPAKRKPERQLEPKPVKKLP